MKGGCIDKYFIYLSYKKKYEHRYLNKKSIQKKDIK